MIFCFVLYFLIEKNITGQGKETHCLNQQLVMPATSCIPVVTGGSVTRHPYVHPFIFLMKFESAMKFSPGVCEHVASDFSNSVNYPLLYFIPFRSYCFSCFIQKLLFSRFVQKLRSFSLSW